MRGRKLEEVETLTSLGLNGVVRDARGRALVNPCLQRDRQLHGVRCNRIVVCRTNGNYAVASGLGVTRPWVAIRDLFRDVVQGNVVRMT